MKTTFKSMNPQSLEDFTKYLKKKGYSQSSRVAYEKIVSAFLIWAEARHMDVEYVPYSELMEYLQYLRKRKVGQRTVQGYLTAITHYFESLKEAHVIEQNPASYVTIKTKKTRTLYPILNKEQLESLYLDFNIQLHPKATRSSAKASAIRNRIATGLMVYQGLEVSALSRVEKGDVNVLDGTITIRGSRTSNRRVLALQAKQIIELDRYIVETRKELQHHFKKEENDQLLVHGYTHYYDAHRRLMQGLKRQSRSLSGPEILSTHQVRTSVITHWLKGYNLREVQYLAGHKHVGSTEAYQQNDMESLKMDIEKFHPMR